MKLLKENKCVKAFKQLDRYILLNNRVLWETKAHYLTLYLVISTAFITVASCFIWVGNFEELINFTDFHFPNTHQYQLMIIGVNVIVGSFWLYQSFKYSIDQNFGFNIPFVEQSRFLIYFSGFFLLGFCSFIPKMIVEFKVDRVISLDNINTDIQILNEGNIYFPIDVTNKTTNAHDNVFIVRNNEEHPEYIVDYFEKHGSSQFHTKIIDTRTEQGKIELNILIEKAKDRKRAMTAINRYLAVLKKYVYYEQTELTTEDIYQQFLSETSILGERIPKYRIKEQMRYLYVTRSLATAYIQTLWSFALGAFILAMFVQLERHVGLKSLLVGITFTLSIVIGVSVLSLVGRSIELFVFFTFILYAMLSIQVGSVSTLKRYSKMATICLVALQLLSPFVVFYFMLLMPSNNYRDIQELIIPLISVGCLLYVFAFLPFFRKAHLRLNALPKR